MIAVKPKDIENPLFSSPVYERTMRALERLKGLPKRTRGYSLQRPFGHGRKGLPRAPKP